MTLEQKLTRLKKFEQERTEPDWEAYKEQWIKSIEELRQTIMNK